MAITQDELIDSGVSLGLIDRQSLARLRSEARQRREPLSVTAARQGRFPVAALYRAAADARQLPFVDLSVTLPCTELLGKMPRALLRRKRAIPVSRQNGSVVVATIDPDDGGTLASIGRILGGSVAVALTDPESLEHAVDRVFTAAPGSDLEPKIEVDPVEALDHIMGQAFVRRASDVHLESVQGGLRVRLRIDGHLHEFLSGLDEEAAASIISRVKVLSGLDIAEQRAPQDGRFAYQPQGHDDVEVDVRVATIPTRWGERATLRLLGTESDELTLENLGMGAADFQQFKQAIRRPYGIILLTGPTGSGKTTTLYAALREINQSSLNIMTVEDPIEYMIDGISQVRVGGTDKVTFASALRSLLRHDPDVLMVGEIRDYETADVAMKAAMTGHLIFSTLHTNSACGAVTRLIDIGCEPYLVGATLTGAIAQRLVRRLCSHCKRGRRPTEREAEQLGGSAEDLEICEPAGCARCLGSGYYGRVGLFEALWLDDDLAELVSKGVSESELVRHARGSLKTLRDDGLEKVRAGLTSLDEVIRVTVAGI